MNHNRYLLTMVLAWTFIQVATLPAMPLQESGLSEPPKSDDCPGHYVGNYH